ncbi:MAG TPA: PAAR domain-containing protein [Acidiphilium sp.]|uniref:PAAR domain-containing protein n=2 Tax=unclassified Acidiphilium TaxID=2617493 RepID=UPI000BDC3E32|nr:PAAR domain-containing protein [Acidiphilium sp. 34-64-41]OZB22095.1 MAG: hypothetical protein B7X49_17335 [Acidiphilium sp. 34-64-41]HQT90223.1 PAAR domain-containing protein [Acidiphilium sp.]
MSGQQPAARATDMHTCPQVTGIVPHVGGPVIMGSPNVFIGSLPAARVGDPVTCVGPPDTILMGSPTVLINGRPAARMGDATAHGGVIVGGLPTVLIGVGGPGSATSVAQTTSSAPGQQQAQVIDAAATNASEIPDPNGVVPGGPWTAAGPGQRPGTFFGPKQVRGARQTTRWVPPEDQGGPPGSKGYWKTKTPDASWQRYDRDGNPISPEQAHPGPSKPTMEEPEAQPGELPDIPVIEDPFL